ncbi:serpentine type 7TM GPCR chemoreceptor srt domain-containing protein [Ditylenchus destructor]|uniref:Serpentine type 7TM GPCR chemoreceptor srt domain-containing protein n=1 Tax=Ditylenchus destructor TaxID=166010 RepID=A0AAD4NJA1_9BILA|nr:serpentine type 7TM GPCR chemoreceptor srt domain-containing protein [Ditylenchus destructor]
MEKYLFERDVFDRLYNCSYNVSDVPLEVRKHRVFGIALIALSSIFELLTIPCVYAIGKNLKYASFKFMFYIAISDFFALWFTWSDGFLSLNGEVYCSSPALTYICGMFALAFWMAGSTSSMMLAMNRCVELWSPRFGQMLFSGKRPWIWLAMVTLYWSVTIFLGPVTVFNSAGMGYYFNPHFGYRNDIDGAFENFIFVFHNSTITIGLFILYLLFLMSLVLKRQSYAPKARSTKLPFMQIFAISGSSMLASSIYLFMQFVTVNPGLIILANFMWTCSHGMPSVIYLTMNETVRRELRRTWKRLHGENVSTAATTTSMKSSAQPKSMNSISDANDSHA